MAGGFCRISRVSKWRGNVATCLLLSHHSCLSFSLLSSSFSCSLPFSCRFRFTETTNDDKEGERFVRNDTKTRRLTDPKQERCSSIKDRRFDLSYKFLKCPEIDIYGIPTSRIQADGFDIAICDHSDHSDPTRIIFQKCKAASNLMKSTSCISKFSYNIFI